MKYQKKKDWTDLDFFNLEKRIKKIKKKLGSIFFFQTGKKKRIRKAYFFNWE